MGYAFYTLTDGREAGYTVEAPCDLNGCEATITRGLDHLCGGGSRLDNQSEPGCGDYFCPLHQRRHDCPTPPVFEDEDDATHVDEGLAKEAHRG